MTAGAKCYADYQEEHTLVSVSVWCRPQDLGAVRDYAAQLVRGGKPAETGSRETKRSTEHWADLSRRAVLMAQGWRNADAQRGKASMADHLRQEKKHTIERFKARPEPLSAPAPRAGISSVPRLLNDDPAQLRRVIQYHHPDKNNPGADARLFLRAKERLALLRGRNS